MLETRRCYTVRSYMKDQIQRTNGSHKQGTKEAKDAGADLQKQRELRLISAVLGFRVHSPISCTPSLLTLLLHHPGTRPVPKENLENPVLYGQIPKREYMSHECS